MNITVQRAAIPAFDIAYEGATVVLARILQAAAQGSIPKHPSHIYLAQAQMLRENPALAHKLREYLA